LRRLTVLSRKETDLAWRILVPEDNSLKGTRPTPVIMLNGSNAATTAVGLSPKNGDRGQHDRVVGCRRDQEEEQGGGHAGTCLAAPKSEINVVDGISVSAGRCISVERSLRSDESCSRFSKSRGPKACLSRLGRLHLWPECGFQTVENGPQFAGDEPRLVGSQLRDDRQDLRRRAGCSLPASTAAS
jgi:hypothetical protein